jgi:hypothetical protein
VRVVSVTLDARVYGWRVVGGVSRKCWPTGSWRASPNARHDYPEGSSVIPTSNAQEGASGSGVVRRGVA